jgi:putative Mn2+ efflux pump MntP
MAMFASLFVLAFAVSLDGFAVGISYGMRRIRIPPASIAVICVCSGFVIFASMQIGHLLMLVLSERTAESIGACLLIGIGAWAIANLLRGDRNKLPEPAERPDPHGLPAAHDAGTLLQQTAQRVVRIEIRSFGLVIEILKHPTAADVDRSGNISPGEAAILGVALSLDAFGAGLGAALIGLSPWITPVVIGLSSGLFIVAGLQAGAKMSGMNWTRRLIFLPGMILIAIGILKLM